MAIRGCTDRQGYCDCGCQITWLVWKTKIAYRLHYVIAVYSRWSCCLLNPERTCDCSGELVSLHTVFTKIGLLVCCVTWLAHYQFSLRRALLPQQCHLLVLRVNRCWAGNDFYLICCIMVLLCQLGKYMWCVCDVLYSYSYMDYSVPPSPLIRILLSTARSTTINEWWPSGVQEVRFAVDAHCWLVPTCFICQYAPRTLNMRSSIPVGQLSTC